MSTPQIVRYGARRMAEFAANQSAVILFNKMRLFISDSFETFETTLGDVTECNYAGYAEQTLNGAAAVLTNNASQVIATFPAVTFTLSAYAGPAKIIYGWYTVDDSGPAMTSIRRLSTPYTVPAGGGSVVVTLAIPLRNV